MTATGPVIMREALFRNDLVVVDNMLFFSAVCWVCVVQGRMLLSYDFFFVYPS